MRGACSMIACVALAAGCRSRLLDAGGDASTAMQASALAAGAGHTCAILAGGAVSCWGDNSLGQLGDGTKAGFRATPGAVPSVRGAVELAAGDDFTCARLGDGSVVCWGDMAGPGAPSSLPTQLWPASRPVAQLALESNRVCVRFTDGKIDCASDTRVVLLAAGAQHLCEALDDGTVQCWGVNVCGVGGPPGAYNSGPIAGVSAPLALALGSQHSCALGADRAVRCWGCNANGQLGDGTLADRAAPVAVVGLSGATAAIAARWQRSCAIDTDGNARCWGLLDLVDHSMDTQHVTATPVAGLGAVTSLALGRDHACATTAIGVVCWGHNDHGQLGDGTTISREPPAPVQFPTP